MAEETNAKEASLSVNGGELNALAIGLNNTGWKPQDFQFISRLVGKLIVAAKSLEEKPIEAIITPAPKE